MAGWRAPLPVANSSSVSLVEVSESTVMALKDGPTPASQAFLQHGRRQAGVGEDEGQHGRHVGRDHARALGDAVDRHLVAVDLRGGVASLGKVSVVMIASAAARQLPAAPCATRPERTAMIFLVGSGSPITPVEAMNTSC